MKSDQILESEVKSIFDRATDYYRGERISNAILIFIGLGAIVWTLLLFLWRQGHLSTGLFFSAFPLSMFYVVTGAYRFVRSLKRYRSISSDLGGSDDILSDELSHLQGRLKRFQRKRKVDTVGFLLGFLLILCSVAFHWNHLFLGTAVSITSFSSILLVFDLFGQFRTEEFIHHILKENSSEQS